MSLSSAGVMAEFRSCLRRVVTDRLVVREGSAGVEAEAYRRAAVRSFVPRGGNASSRRVLLSLLPNGDWRCHDTVEVFVAPGTVVDKAAIIRKVVQGLVQALAHRRFRVYARHRWTGSEESVSDIGILLVCHGLLGPVWAQCCPSSSA